MHSDEILGVMRERFEEVSLRSDGALTCCMTRSRQAHAKPPPTALLPRVVAAGRRRAARVIPWVAAAPTISAEFLRELIVAGDVLADAAILQPATAFAVYRKRR